MALRALHQILIACAFFAASAGARGLDQRQIHGYYSDGEFDKVITSLTDYGKTCQCSRADSIFAEKHLAVVYAANPSTRELGRYHMYLMLNLAPGADLLDMFVGEEVDAVFEKVRKEHTVRAVAQKPAAKKNGASPQVSRKPAPKPIAARPAPRPGSETLPPSGAYANARAAAARPAPNPFAKSARTLLEGHAPVPVRVAGLQPQGVFAAATVVPAAQRPTAAPAPVAAAVPSAALRSVASLREPAQAAAPLDARSRAFPLSAYVPKPAAAIAVRSAAPALTVTPAAKAVVKSKRPIAAVDAASPGKPLATTDEERDPVWKEPGLWIGGGAALAVIAFTLFTAGGDEKSAASKTYVVPATAAK